MSDLMTPKDLSEMLGVPAKTLANWRHQNKGPAYAKFGKHIRYRRSAVEAWLSEQTVHPERE